MVVLLSAALTTASRLHADEPGRASASSTIAKAKRAFSDLRYEQALILLDQALASGNNSPEDMEVIQRLLGLATAALGEAQEAQFHFIRLLLLNPDAHLDDGVSPKLRQPFEQARQDAAAARPLGFSCTIDRTKAAPILAVQVTSDPLSWARQVSAGKVKVKVNVDDGKARVTLPAEQPVAAEIALLDEYGNQLLSQDSAVCTAAAANPPAALSVQTDEQPVSVDRSAPVYARWQVWAGATVGVTAVGGVFGWRAHRAVDELNERNRERIAKDLAEGMALQDTARISSSLANISYGVATAAAVLTGVLFYRTRRDRSKRRVEVHSAAGTNGANATVRWSF
jgi:predicted MarR family transcription regulator